jgi:hypothetical protein
MKQIIRLSSMAMGIPNNPAPGVSPEDHLQQLAYKQSILTCIENLCLALSSLLLYGANHERMIGRFNCLPAIDDSNSLCLLVRLIVVNGLEECIKICKITSEPSILKSVGKVIATMVPHPRELIVSLLSTASTTSSSSLPFRLIVNSQRQESPFSGEVECIANLKESVIVRFQ